MLAISCLANRDFAFSTDLRWGNKVGQYSDRRYEGKKKKKGNLNFAHSWQCLLGTKRCSHGQLSAPYWRESSSSPTTWQRQQWQQDNTEWCVQASLKRSYLQGFSSNSWRCLLMLAAHWQTKCFPQKRFLKPLVSGRAAGIRTQESFFLSSQSRLRLPYVENSYQLYEVEK